MQSCRATRRRLKHDGGIILARLIAPLAMRGENQLRRQYRKEVKRYERYVREQQKLQQQQRKRRSAHLPGKHSGAADESSLRGGAESWAKRLVKRVCKAARELKPKRLSEAGEDGTMAPVRRPGYVPHWHGARPKPTPHKRRRRTPGLWARLLGRCTRAGRGAAARKHPCYPYYPERATTAEAKKILAAHRKGMRIVNRKDMPAYYRHTVPY